MEVPVIAGVSSNSTFEAAKRAKRAQELGADRILVLPPFYLRYHPNGLVKHFETIASETDLDIILYNSPDFTGIDIPTDDLIYVVEKVPRITAIKDSTTDMLEFAHRLVVLNMRTQVLLGNEPYCYFGIFLGSDGAFTSMASFMPKPIQMMYDCILDGKDDDARKIYLALTPYMNFRRRTRNPIAVVKQAMIFSGIKINHYVRPPLVELSEEQRTILKNILNALRATFE